MDLNNTQTPIRVDTARLITQTEYAKRRKLTRQRIHAMIKAGLLNTVQVTGTILILLDHHETDETAPELNTEDLRRLSIADLSNLLTLIKLYPKTVKKASTVMPILTAELQKRMDNLFIF